MDNIIIDTKELFEGSDLTIESVIKSLKKMCPDVKLLDFSLQVNFEASKTSRLHITMDYSDDFQNVNIGMSSINTNQNTYTKEVGDEECH